MCSRILNCGLDKIICKYSPAICKCHGCICRPRSCLGNKSGNSAKYVIGSEMYAIRKKFMFNYLENRTIYGKNVLGIERAFFLQILCKICFSRMNGYSRDAQRKAKRSSHSGCCFCSISTKTRMSQQILLKPLYIKLCEIPFSGSRVVL